MAIMRWTPMGHLPSFQHEMNRMVNEFFGGGNGEAASTGLSSWTPAVDVYETDDALVIKAELPGVSKDDISVDVHEHTLTLRGQRKHETEVKDEQYHRVERSYGSFQRSFNLPSTIDDEKVQATFKDGVLELHLPRLESAKPRQIAIHS
jgi:HSP20 family protein